MNAGGLAAAPHRPPGFVKPRMRGWIHLWSFAAAVPACAVLVAVSAVLAGGRAALATAAYGLTVLGVFGVSALYHRRQWATRRAWVLMRRLDHSMIFIFIAGTYTPVSVLALPPGTAVAVLATVWGGALGGVALKMFWPGAPVWLAVPIYVALGWVAVFVLPDLLAHAGVAALVLLLAGGALYTVGALFYATRWPNPWPEVFGHHEFFHAAVSLAATCHMIAIWLALPLVG